jgi:hypothetical protein
MDAKIIEIKTPLELPAMFRQYDGNDTVRTAQEKYKRRYGHFSDVVYKWRGYWVLPVDGQGENLDQTRAGLGVSCEGSHDKPLRST